MFNKISKNFFWYEMYVTDTGLDNNPIPSKSNHIRKKLQQLADNVLQPARDLVGRIKTTSVFRSFRVNKAVGGVPTSQHAKGEAADIIPLDMDINEAFDLIRLSDIPYDQLILEKNKRGNMWIHISYRSRGGRRVAMKATWNFLTNKMDFRYV